MADELVPDPKVQKEFGISAMTLRRWDDDPKLNFPPAIKIKTRKYRSRRALDAFKAELLRKAIADRNKKPPRQVKTRRPRSWSEAVKAGGDAPATPTIAKQAASGKRGGHDLADANH